MARQAVLDILEESLGKYIQGLDVNQLSVSLWKGQIDFPRSLKLDAQAINNAFLYNSSVDNAGDQGSDNDATTQSLFEDMVEDWAMNFNCDKTNCESRYQQNTAFESTFSFSPTSSSFLRKNKTPGSKSFLRRLRLVKGTISKIQIEIPWVSLASRPVVVRISGVNIVMAPAEKKSPPPQPQSAIHPSPGKNIFSPSSVGANEKSNFGLWSPLGQSMTSNQSNHGDDLVSGIHSIDKSAPGYTGFGSSFIGGFSVARSSRFSPSIRNSTVGGGGTATVMSDSRHGNSTAVNSKSSRNTRDSFANRLLKSIPGSSSISQEMLRQRHKKEENIILKRRKNVIETHDKKRIKIDKLRKSMIHNHSSGGVNSRNSSSSDITSGFEDKDDKSTDYDFFRDDGSSICPEEFESSAVILSCGSARSDRRNVFYQRLKRRILENLQLQVTNLHIQLTKPDEDIREEDFNNNKERKNKYLAGIVLDALTFDTTDEHGRRTYVDRMPSAYRKDEQGLGAVGGEEEDFLFKALRISGLGFYLEDKNDLTNSGFGGTAVNDMRSSFIEDEVSFDSRSSMGGGGTGGGSLSPSLLRHDFLIHPFSFEAAYRQSDTSQTYEEYPKYLLFSQLPHLSMMLSKKQLEMANEIIDSFVTTGKPRPLYPEYRPVSSISAYTAKSWWRYAYKCVRRMIRQNKSNSVLWLELVKAVTKRKRYISLYKRHKYSNECLWLTPLSNDEVKELKSIEDDRSISVEGIIIWRTMVDKVIGVERKVYAGGDFSSVINERKGSFMSNLFRASTSDSNKSNSIAGEKSPTIRDSESFDYSSFALTVEEIRELETKLDYISHCTPSHLTHMSKLIEIEFSFGSMVVDLVTTRNAQPLAKLRLGTIDTYFTSTVGGGSTFRFSLMSFHLEDTMSVQPIFPSIVRSVYTKAPPSSNKNQNGATDNASKGGSEDGEDDSFPQAFSLTTVSTADGETKLTLRVVSLEIVASSPFFVEMTDFFCNASDTISSHSSPLGNIFWYSVISVLPQIFYNIVSFQTSANLLKPDVNPMSSDKWVIDCEIDGPILILPDFFCDDHKADILIFDFGSYFIKESNPRGLMQSWLEDLKEEDEEIEEEEEEEKEQGGGPQDKGFDNKGKRKSSLVGKFWKVKGTGLKLLQGTADLCQLSQGHHIKKPEEMESVVSVDDSTESLVTIVDPISFMFKIGQCRRQIEGSQITTISHVRYECEVTPIVAELTLPLFSKMLRISSSWIPFMTETIAGMNNSVGGNLLFSVAKNAFPNIFYDAMSGKRTENNDLGKSSGGNALVSGWMFPQNHQQTQNTSSQEFIENVGFEWSVTFRSVSVLFNFQRGASIQAHIVSLISTVSMEQPQLLIENKSYELCQSNMLIGSFWVSYATSTDAKSRLLMHSSLPSYIVPDSGLQFQKTTKLIRKQTFVKKFFANCSLSCSTDKEIKVDLIVNKLHLNWHPGSVRYFKLIVIEVRKALSSSGGYGYGYGGYSGGGIGSDYGMNISSVPEENYNVIMEEDDVSSVNTVSTGSDMMILGNADAFGTFSLSGFLCSILFPTFYAVYNYTYFPNHLHQCNHFYVASPNHSFHLDTSIDLVYVTLNSRSDINMVILSLSFEDIKIDWKRLKETISSALLEISNFTLKNHTHGKIYKRYEKILAMPKSDSASKSKQKFLTLQYENSSVKKCVPSNEHGGDTNINAHTSTFAQFSPLEIVLSPLQIHGIHTYLSKSVLGLYCSNFAKQVKNSVKDFFVSYPEEQVFNLSMSSTVLLIPHSIGATAPSKEHNISISIDSVSANYKMHPHQGGGDGSFTVCGISVSLNLETQRKIIREPIRISLLVSKPPSIMNQAKSIKVSVSISKAHIALSKEQCTRIMNIIQQRENFLLQGSGNVGKNLELILGESRLIEDLEKYDSYRSVEVEFESNILNSVAGINNNREVIAKKHLDFFEEKITIGAKCQSISFTLCHEELNTSSYDEFLRLTMDDTEVLWSSIPGDDTTSLQFTIRHFSLEDLTLKKTEKSAVRYIVSEIYCEDKEDEEENVISILFTRNNADGAIHALTVVRALQFIVLPKITSDIVDFFSFQASLHSSSSMENDKNTSFMNSYQKKRKSMLDFFFYRPPNTNNNEDSSPDVLPSSSLNGQEKMKNDSMSLKMNSCRIIFSLDDSHASALPTSFKNFNLILQGKVDIECTRSASSNYDSIVTSLHSNGEDMELYITKNDGLFSNPTQISELVNISFVLYSSYDRQNGDYVDVDIKFVSLSDLSICVSTRDMLLMSTIFSEMQKSIKGSSDTNKSSTETSDLYLPCFNVKGSFTVPRMTLVLLDDIYSQGQALLKSTTENFILSGTAYKIPDLFVNFNQALEYYNSYSKQWERWLKKPCDMSISLKRKENESFESVGKFSTNLHVQSSPLQLSLTNELVKKIRYTLDTIPLLCDKNFQSKEKDIMTSKTRKFPYGIDNRTHLQVSYSIKDDSDAELCMPGQTQFFTFDCIQAFGSGKKRLYGQDSNSPKTISLSFGDESSNDTVNTSSIIIQHIDDEVNFCRAHDIGDDQIVFTDVINTGTSLILRLRPQVTIYNFTRMIFGIEVVCHDKRVDLGAFESSNKGGDMDNESTQHKIPPYKCIPQEYLQDFNEFTSDTCGIKLHLYNPETNEENSDKIRMMPYLDDSVSTIKNWGLIDLPSSVKLMKVGADSYPFIESILDGGQSLSFDVLIKSTVVNQQPLAEIFLRPRVILQNCLPVTIYVKSNKTNMSSIDNGDNTKLRSDTSSLIQRVDAGKELFINSYGSSFNVSVGFSEEFTADSVDSSNEILLGPDDRVTKPLEFKPMSKSGTQTEGIVYMIENEGGSVIDSNIQALSPELKNEINVRCISIQCSASILDHTGDLQFSYSNASNDNYDSELIPQDSSAPSHKHVALLQDINKRIYAKQKSANEKFMSFCPSEIQLSEGGLECHSLHWEDQTESGYCAFKQKKVSQIESYTIHIIPEYILVNSSGHDVTIVQSSSPDHTEVNSFGSSMLKMGSGELKIVIRFQENGWFTEPILISGLRTITTSLKTEDEDFVGGLAVDILSGGQDARVMVNVGPPQIDENFTTEESNTTTSPFSIFTNLFEKDFLRFRLSCKSIQMFITELRMSGRSTQVALVDIESFNISYQHIFLFENNYETLKDEHASVSSIVRSIGRYRLSISVGHLKLSDSDPSSSFIMSSYLPNSNSVDISVYFRGKDIDMINVNLWSSQNGSPNKVMVFASDIFLMKLGSILCDMKDSYDTNHHKILVGEQDQILSTTYPPPIPQNVCKFNVVRISPIELEVNIREATEMTENMRLHESVQSFLTQFPATSPIEMNLKIAEFSSRNVHCNIYPVLHMATLTLKTRLKFHLLKNSNSYDRTERDFILSSLADSIKVVPPLKDGTFFRTIGYHAADEFDSLFNLVNEQSSRAVIKEASSGTILYSSSTQISNCTSGDKSTTRHQADMNRMDRPKPLKPIPLGASTRNFFSSSFRLPKNNAKTFMNTQHSIIEEESNSET